MAMYYKIGNFKLLVVTNLVIILPIVVDKVCKKLFQNQILNVRNVSSVCMYNMVFC